MMALRKVFSYQFSSGLAVERFAEEAILFVAARDELITMNHGAADLFERALAASACRAFGRAEASVWFERTFDLTAQEVKSRVPPLLAFALRHGIVVKQPAQDI